MFGAIGSNGYTKGENEKDVCIINGNNSVCSYGIWVGLVGFFAAMAFIAGEYLFEQMSSAKSRKHYVLADLGFSGLWTFMYFVGFCYISNQWSSSPEPPNNGSGSGNVTCAIIFSLLSIFSWAGCTYFAFLRFKAGVTEIPFQSTYESDPNQGAYSSYANENEQYQEPPFSQQQMGGQQQQQQFQAPTY